jgi:hypothetical protein
MGKLKKSTLEGEERLPGKQEPCASAGHHSSCAWTLNFGHLHPSTQAAGVTYTEQMGYAKTLSKRLWNSLHGYFYSAELSFSFCWPLSPCSFSVYNLSQENSLK